MIPKSETACEHTDVDCRGTCGFCGKEENGYAKRDVNGKWQPACWACVRPASAGAAQPKRKLIGSILSETVVEDLGLVEEKKKAPGMAPSTYRPAVR